MLFAAAPAARALSLSEALDAARQHDPAYAEVLATHAADIELAPQERAVLRPLVDATGRYDFAHTESDGVFGSTEDDYPTWSAGVTLRQALFRLDWQAINDRADARTERANLALLAGELDLRARVAQAYFDVLVAERALQAAQAQAQSVRKSLEDTQKRYDAEVVPGTDLREAQARDDLSRASLVIAERDVDTARDRLQDLTGTVDARLHGLDPQIAFPPLDPPDLATWLDAARDNSPALADAREQLRIAEADRRSRKAEAVPSVDLVGSYQHSDSTEYDFGQRQDDARIGVEVTVPLYAGGATRAALREQEARVRAAQARLDQAVTAADRETREAFRNLHSAEAQASAYALALKSAELAEEAVRNGYDAGTRTIADVLDAQSAVVDARRNLDDARYGVLTSLVALRQSAGVLTDADLARIDSLLIVPQPAPTRLDLPTTEPVQPDPQSRIR